MKLASYVAEGKRCFGVVAGDGVVTLNERLGGRYGGLREALAAGALAEIAMRQRRQPDHALGEIEFLPAIPIPEKILCAGIYCSHAAETGRELPKQPSMFIRLANTLTGHEGEMIRPSVSQNFDFEGELAVVIGRGGRHIPVERALEHVAGYTCFVDGSVRDYQKFLGDLGQELPGTGPLRTLDRHRRRNPDPTRLTLTTRLNGRRCRSRAPIFSSIQCPRSSPAPTSPACAGRRHRHRHARRRRPSPQPASWMKSGDVLEVEISGIGTLRNRVADEK